MNIFINNFFFMTRHPYLYLYKCSYKLHHPSTLLYVITLSNNNTCT